MDKEVKEVLDAMERAKKVTWENRKFDMKGANAHRDKIIEIMKEASCKPSDKLIEVRCDKRPDGSGVSIPKFDGSTNLDRERWERGVWHKIRVESLVFLDCEMAGPFQWNAEQERDEAGNPVSEIVNGKYRPKIVRSKVPEFEYTARSCGQEEDE